LAPCGVMAGAKVAAMIAATGAMTEVTGGMTAVTVVADLGSCGDSS
jgi:hypothetical protein